jgi:zinc protease
VKRAVISVILAIALPCAAQPKPAPAPQPKPAPAAQPDPWAGKSDLFSLPTVTPTTQVNLGAVQRFVLPNGIKVIAVPRPSVPAVDVTLVVKAGDNESPLDKAGLAQFTASMLRKGTQKRTSDQIATAIDFVGGELDGSSDDDGTFVSCQSRSKDFQLCLDLLSDVVLHPTFPEAEMGEIREQLLSSVEGAKDSPQALAAKHATNLYFGDADPRGRSTSKRSLGLIDRTALQAFYKTWYAPNNSVMVVSGDFDAKALKSNLAKWFGAWKKHDVPKIAARGLPAPGKLQVRLVDKPDATQSSIVLVGPGLKHADPDYCAARLMNFSLGAGGFSSRLMKVVRSEGGKTYGARSSYEARREPGPFTASTFTRTPETVATLELVMNEIKRMRESGPNDEELAAAKGNLIGGYGLKLETGGDMARALLTAELDGLPADWVQKYPALLNAVTVKDAAAAAAAHLQPTSLVIVGKADEVKPLLAKAGYTDVEIVSYTDPVSAAERKAIAEEKQAAGTATAEEADLGKKLLDAALVAKGGAELGKVTDLVMRGKGTMSVQGQTLPISVEEFYVPGKSVREDISVGPGKVTQIFDTGKAFMRQGDKVFDLPPPAATSMLRNLWRDPNFILLHASAPGAKVRALPPVTDGGVKYDALTLVSPDGEPTRVLLDPKTHLIARLVYTDDGKEVRDELADYQSEGTIPFPHKVVHLGDGQKIEVTYDKIVVNKGLPADVFKR